MLRRPLVAAALAALTLAGSTVLASAPARAACAPLVRVPGIGSACPAPGGYLVPMPDGTTLFTHGPDRAPARSPYSDLFFPPSQDPACVHDTGIEHFGQVVYARSADAPDRYARMVEPIRRITRAANGLVDAAAQRVGLSARYRVRCVGNKISVANVVVPVRNKGDVGLDFTSVITELYLLGYSDPRVKYWIWLDDFRPYKNVLGIASVEHDDAGIAENPNNFGPSYAMIFGLPPSEVAAIAFAHEIGHTMGAVQYSAPHSTGAGHCNDGADVMCYNDGGPSARYRPNVCRSYPQFDCRGDDYFNVRPTRGSYLATHWNIGSPLNRYIEGCVYVTDSVTVGLGGQAVAGLSSSTYGIPASCGRHSFALHGVRMLPIGLPHGLLDVPLSGVLTRLVPADFNVCWYRDARRLGCRAQAGTDEGVVPAGATAAEITLVAGPQATFVLSVF